MLDHLETLSEENAETYEKFYREFGVILREGVTNHDGNRDRVAALLRFGSTNSVGTSGVSLNAYCDRVKPGQDQIYYACGTDQASVLRDPNLEVFRKRNVEVLLLTDPADEYVLSALGSFRDKTLVSIDAAELKLPPETDQEKSEDAKPDAEKSGAPAGSFDVLVGLIRESLGNLVQDVRRSERLTESVCSLVNSEGSMSTTMQRILRMNAPDFEMGRMVLEINPNATLIKRLADLAGNHENHGFIRDCSRQLHANAMIQAGLAPDGNEMAARLQDFMLQLASQKPVATP